jgi:hypothetical protein
MLVPGGYRYEQKGSDAKLFRTGVGSFALPVDRDEDGARWFGIGMQPVPAGFGGGRGRLVLSPAEVTDTPALAGNLDTNMQGIVYLGAFYFSQGANLYKIAGGAYAAPVLIGAAGGTILSMAVVGDVLNMATTAAGTMSNYSGSGAIVNTPAVNAGMVWSYAQGLWRSKKNAVTAQYSVISGSIDGGATWTDWQLDSVVRSAVPWRGRATGGGVMLVGTQHRLWELAGQWGGSPAAFSGTVSVVYSGAGGGAADDFAALVLYRGDAYAWYAGTLHRWDGTNLLPVAGGPRGVVFGMAAAAGYLWVSYNDYDTGSLVIAGYDGTRWFQLIPRAAITYVGLSGTDGAITDGHLISGQSGSKTLSRWRLPLVNLDPTARTSGQVLIGPLDAGQGDAVKVWTEVTAAYSAVLTPSMAAYGSPPGGALLVEYSTDDGQSFTTAGTLTIAAGSRAGSPVQSLNSGAGVEAARLTLRLTWTPTSNYPAWQLDGVWASGYLVADAPRLEQWTLDIRCTDRLIKRDDSVDTRTGEQMLTALRSLAQNRSVVAFQDLDFDLSARSVNVRVTGFEERDRKPDASRSVESVCRLTVAAVN